MSDVAISMPRREAEAALRVIRHERQRLEYSSDQLRVVGVEPSHDWIAQVAILHVIEWRLRAALDRPSQPIKVWRDWAENELRLSWGDR